MEPFTSLVDHSRFYYATAMHWLSRRPKQTPARYNLIKVFSLNVWLAVIISLASIAMAFAWLHYIYRLKTFEGLGFAGPVNGWIDFPLLTFCSLTEPDPIKFFPKFSAGITIALQSKHI